jgi:hypothetical protein
MTQNRADTPQKKIKRRPVIFSISVNNTKTQKKRKENNSSKITIIIIIIIG